MEAAFQRLGPHGPRMMCSTAYLQICLDAGEADQTALRWRALHDLGPALVALFANSRRRAGADTGWASARTEATFGTCAPFTEPPPLDGDPPPRGPGWRWKRQCCAFVVATPGTLRPD